MRREDSQGLPPLPKAWPEDDISGLLPSSEAEDAARYRTLRRIGTTDSALWRALDCGHGLYTPEEFDHLVDRALKQHT